MSTEWPCSSSLPQSSLRTRYWRPRPRRRDFRSVGRRSIDEPGRWQGLEEGTKRLRRAGLIFEMWSVGWNASGLGSRSLTTTRFTTFAVEKGLTNLGTNFILSRQSGRSKVKSHTFCPTEYTGAGERCLLAHFFVGGDRSQKALFQVR